MRKKRNYDLFDEMAQPRVVPTVTKQPEYLLEAMATTSYSTNYSPIADHIFKTIDKEGSIPQSDIVGHTEIKAIRIFIISNSLERLQYLNKPEIRSTFIAM